MLSTRPLTVYHLLVRFLKLSAQYLKVSDGNSKKIRNENNKIDREYICDKRENSIVGYHYK